MIRACTVLLLPQDGPTPTPSRPNKDLTAKEPCKARYHAETCAVFVSSATVKATFKTLEVSVILKWFDVVLHHRDEWSKLPNQFF